MSIPAPITETRADARSVRAARIAIVVPTIGRATLIPLLAALHSQAVAAGGRSSAVIDEIVVVDDRPRPPCGPVAVDPGPPRIRLVRTGGRGPAAARNAGWRCSLCDWIVFIDDDVSVRAGWVNALCEDVTEAADHVVGVQGRILVPVGPGPSTDWARQTRRLETGRWITADMAYRRAVLAEVGGFDEAFRRAYREDSDLGLRAARLGDLTVGSRRADHPVRPEDWTASVRRQRGNADDVLMRRKHGPGWRTASASPRGRLPVHVGIVTALLAVPAWWPRHPRAGVVAASLGTAGMIELFARRIAGTDHDVRAYARVAATTAAIPFAATAWWSWGTLRRWPQRPTRPAAVLFDRDGTLIEDVPYNGDPELVVPVAGARRALDRLRRAGIPVGIVSNQSAVGLGKIDAADVEACNRRLEALLGPFDVTTCCPHTDADRCDCRKPRAGMVREAAARLGVAPAACLVIGDTAADSGAAEVVGARSILVPNAETRPIEVDRAPLVAPDLAQAVAMVLAGAS